jgi:Rps23 Pro-64 3,4-dihydroxylase Tpa1-like proline 4-hydroxylase
MPQVLSAPFRFDNAAVTARPFPHFEAEDFLDVPLADALLTWFEEKANWQVRKLVGYAGYSDISLMPVDLPRGIDALVLPETFSYLRSCMGKFFKIEPEGYVRVTAHRLLAGASLRPHTDLAPLRFTHRLIVQLNRGWTHDNGGLLCIADSERSCSEKKSPKLITPTHNNAFAFEVSERSFHSVTQVVKGERYTLSYTFYPPIT